MIYSVRGYHNIKKLAHFTIKINKVEPFEYEAQTTLYKDPDRAAQ